MTKREKDEALTPREPMPEEERGNLRRIATFVKEHVRRSRMASLDEVDMLARGVLSLLDERLTTAEAGAIQAVSEVERLKARVAQLESALRPLARYVDGVEAVGATRSEVIHGVYSGRGDCELRLSDLRATRDALGSVPAARVFTEAEVREALKAHAGLRHYSGQYAVDALARTLGLSLD